MFSLLIVDDEAPIADGLCDVMQSLPSPELDVYKAYSGAEALHILEVTRIDIVLSDIRMPQMSGLDLLEEIKRRWPQCRVIFLTGYADFDSVYAAIQHEGVSYLLKTDGYDAVIGAVEKAAADIESAVKTADLVQAANDQMTKAKALLRENYLNGIVRGRFNRTDIDQKQFDELCVPLRVEKPVILLAGRIENLSPTLRYPAKIGRLYRIQAVAQHFLRPPQAVAVCLIDESPKLVWLIQPCDSSLWQSCVTYVKGSAASIQDAAAGSLGLVLSFALDGGPTEWAALPDRLADLRMLLDYRIGRDSGMLLIRAAGAERILDRVLPSGIPSTQRVSPERPAVSDNAEAIGAAASRARLEQLAEYLEFGERSGFFDRLRGLTAGFTSDKDIHDLPILETYHSIALMLLHHINRWSMIEKVAARIGLHKLMTAESHGTWGAAREYLEQLCGILFDVREAEEEGRVRDAVSTVQKHICDHIREPDLLTLVYLADLVHLNPSYLSRLFKHQTGVKLSDQIAETRIKEAKCMLENGRVKVHEVAAALGYGTAANFTRFFKKYVDLTPQEYRDRHAGQRQN